MRPFTRLRSLAAFPLAALLAALFLIPTAAGAAPAAPGSANVDPDHSALVINVGWPADSQGRGTSLLDTAELGAVTNFLSQTGNRWLRDSASGVWQDWTFTPAGSFTISTPRNAGNTTCTGNQAGDFFDDIRSRAKVQAEGAGWHPNEYTRVFISWRSQVCGGISGISDFGMKEIGVTGPGSTPMHELAHTFGLDHAAGIYCTNGAGQPVPLSNNCGFQEYGDHYDVMGSGQKAFSAANAYRLGWLNGQFASLSEGVYSQTFTLKPYTALPHGLRAIRLTDGGRNFWIEYRAPVGLDNEVLDEGFFLEFVPSLLVHREGAQRDLPYPVTELLDMSPAATPKDTDASMTVGQTWSNPLGTMRITLNSMSLAGASVTISSTQTKVPNTKGMTSAAAKTAIQAAGLVFGIPGEELDPSCDYIGLVRSSNPDFGAAVYSSTKVTVKIGKEDPKHECL